MKSAWILIITIGIGNPNFKQVDQMHSIQFANQEACEQAKVWVLSNAANNLESAAFYGIDFVAVPDAECFPVFIKK